MAEEKNFEIHLGLLGKQKEEINWILEKQAELRSELLAFYKKDIKEIDAAISDIKTDKEDYTFRKDILDKVQANFVTHWEQSYNLIFPKEILTAGDISAGQKIGQKSPDKIMPERSSETAPNPGAKNKG
jgi:hypothetical protein